MPRSVSTGTTPRHPRGDRARPEATATRPEETPARPEEGASAAEGSAPRPEATAARTEASGAASVARVRASRSGRARSSRRVARSRRGRAVTCWGRREGVFPILLGVGDAYSLREAHGLRNRGARSARFRREYRAKNAGTPPAARRPPPAARRPPPRWVLATAVCPLTTDRRRGSARVRVLVAPIAEAIEHVPPYHEATRRRLFGPERFRACGPSSACRGRSEHPTGRRAAGGVVASLRSSPCIPGGSARCERPGCATRGWVRWE